MKELTAPERDCIADLIAAWDLPKALVTLAEWAWSDDPAGEEGRQQIRLKGWSDAWAAWTAQPPDGDSLRDLGGSRAQWESAPVIALMQALESLMEDEWPPRGTVLLRVSSVCGAGYYVVRKAPGASPRADRQPHEVPHVLRRLNVVPRRQGRLLLDLTPLDQRTDKLLRDRQDVPTGYVVHFEEGFQLRVAEHAQGIQVEAVHDAEEHRDKVLRHLRGAGAVTFLVYPECTLPPALRLELRRTIAASTEPVPNLTLAGSFHDPQDGKPCLNRTELLDHRGAVVLTHVKTASATLRSSKGKPVAEYIDLHNTMHAVVSSLGLVGVAICVEFSSTTGVPLAAWSAVGPRWMLVPSMGEKSTVDMHVRAAKTLRDQHRTFTLISNQSPSGRSQPGCIVGFKGHTREACNQVTSLPPQGG